MFDRLTVHIFFFGTPFTLLGIFDCTILLQEPHLAILCRVWLYYFLVLLSRYLGFLTAPYSCKSRIWQYMTELDKGPVVFTSSIEIDPAIFKRRIIMLA